MNYGIRWFAWVSAMVILAAGAGCTPVPQGPVRNTAYTNLPRVAPSPQPTPPEALLSEPEEIVIGRSVAGRPITARIYGQGTDTILIMATIHGNEPAGTPLARKLGEHLLLRPELPSDKRIIIVPVANPDGMAVGTRGNLRGVDLNRNFPAWNYSATRRHGGQPLSEPESRALHDLILKYSPRRIISIHQPLNCIDHDGAAEGLARAMASSGRLPLKKIGSLAGSLGSFAGVTRKIPIVTVELPRSADNLSTDQLWDRWGRMLLVGICYPDSVPTLAARVRPVRSAAGSPVRRSDDLGN